MHTRLIADAMRTDPFLHVIPFELESTHVVDTLRAERIDVLVISSNLQDHPNRGLEVLLELRTSHLQTRAVLLPESSRDDAILQAFKAGARGIFDKSEPIEQLSKCVRCVHDGQIWANREAVRILVEAVASSPTIRAANSGGMKLLSERELQVVYCIAEGLTNREIAHRLQLSQHTVKNYLFRIFDKLGVSSRVELLFMTLSEKFTPDIQLSAPARAETNEGRLPTTRKTRKRANAAPPAYDIGDSTIGAESQSLISSYMWSLITAERASKAQESMVSRLTPEQIEEAKQKAKVWLLKLRENSSGLENPAVEREPSPPTRRNFVNEA
jgi:DNA-binding NarL/FixJ family response regulator